MPWMRVDCGLAPLDPAKLARVVKVCAGEVIAVAAQNTTAMQAIFGELSFPMVPPSQTRRGTNLNSAEVRRLVIGNPIGGMAWDFDFVPAMGNCALLIAWEASFF